MVSAKILVVEDDMDIRDLLKEFLESVGYEVVVAGNGREALAALRAPGFSPSLVLLDRNMDQMDGDLFLDSVAKDPTLSPRRIPVVMMSAAGVVADGRVAAFLKKPFNFDELLDVVARFSREPAKA